jgi:hypothetical protein
VLGARTSSASAELRRSRLDPDVTSSCPCSGGVPGACGSGPARRARVPRTCRAVLRPALIPAHAWRALSVLARASPPQVALPSPGPSS